MKTWRHVIINARCTWLHGDVRGFRSRRHRIHSSGDYKHRPPPDEHAGLRRFHEARSGDPVAFDLQIRVEVVRAFVRKMRLLKHRIIVCSAGAEHLHALPELPAGYSEVIREVGKCKQAVSYAIRDAMPGSIWSDRGQFKRIKDAAHLRHAYDYIRTRQEPGTVVWSHHDDENWIDDPVKDVLVISPSRKLVPLSRV